jgi:hypothetical protein
MLPGSVRVNIADLQDPTALSFTYDTPEDGLLPSYSSARNRKSNKFSKECEDLVSAGVDQEIGKL